MKKIFLFLIDFYRKYISSAKASPCCRYYPTCSSYAYRAIEEWGALAGILLAAFRILRCNPLFKGGVDHVPLRGSKRRSAEGYVIYYGISPYGERRVKARKNTRNTENS